MPPLRTAGPDRLGERLRQAQQAGGGLLMVYLTLADPLTSGPPHLAEALTRSGADVLELGLPTPSTQPRGAEVAASFRRARDNGRSDPWREIAEVRAAVPDTPLVLLCYPATISDLGWPTLLHRVAASGVDGMVLTDPKSGCLADLTASGIHAIPLISAAHRDNAAHRLEELASCLTYRSLAARTGGQIDANAAARAAAQLAARAAKPFVVGFGIRKAYEVAMLAPHAAGVVIGSELLRLIAAARSRERTAAASAAVRSWKAALAEPASD
jgi:tryptophan synthase alpha chain